MAKPKSSNQSGPPPEYTPPVPPELGLVVRYGLQRTVRECSVREDDWPTRGDEVIVRTERGLEWGEVLCRATEETRRQLAESSGGERTRKPGRVVRRVTDDDRQRRSELQETEPLLFAQVGRIVAEHRLAMTLSDLERTHDGDWAIVYYTAERRVDFRDPEALTESMRGSRTLVHLAAGLSGSTSTLFASGPIATRKLLHAAADAGIERVVLISSLGVYEASGLKRGEEQSEETPVDRQAAKRDAYSYSKIVQERVAREVADARGLELVVLRPGVIFGEGRPTISSRAGLTLGGWLVQMGGRQSMPLTYVENCADAIARAAVADAAAGETINILDDDLPTAAGLVRMVRRLGRPVRRLWVPGPAVPALCGLYHWYSRFSGGQLPPVLTSYRARSMWKPVRYTNRRAKRLLGWTPRVPMDEAIARTVEAENAKRSKSA